MLAELADQSGRLPLLKFALTRLWDHQRVGGIDAEALGRIGGVRRALSDKEAHRRRARRARSSP